MKLVIAPHADDEVLGCGGLLAKYPDECAVVVCAAMSKTREREFTFAQMVLGYTDSRCLGLTDGMIGADERNLVTLLDSVLNTFQPDEVYLPFPSMHQDHVAVYEAGMRACRLSMSAHHWFPPTVMVYDVASYDLVLYPSDLRWNVFEALDEQHVKLKQEALACYESQQVQGAHPVNGVVETAHSLGAARRLAYAEQYAMVREVRA